MNDENPAGGLSALTDVLERAFETLHGIKWDETAFSVRACWTDAWFPVADGAYELVKIEKPDMTHPLFHVPGESFEVAAIDPPPNAADKGPA